MTTCPDFDPSTLELTHQQFLERWRELGPPAHYAMIEDPKTRQLMFDGWLRETAKRRLPETKWVPRVVSNEPDDSDRRHP